MKTESSLYQKMIIAIENSALDEVAVVLNGKPELRNGKIVYASLSTVTSDEPDLNFYTKKSTRNLNSLSSEKVIIPNFYEYLVSAMLSSALYGIKINGDALPEFCTITVCNEMKYLILESHLYANVRKLVEENYTRVESVFRFGKDYLNEEVCQQLCDAFKANSYTNYDALFYDGKSRKILNKLKRRSKDFYSIQSSFIPVFLDYGKVFNPLKCNPVVLKTDFYQKAIEKNRYEERGSLSCYYLTHKEICEALHMKRFMRFTSSFLYKVFIGLMYPNNPNFPSVSRSVMVKPDFADDEFVMIRKSCFSEQEFALLVNKYVTQSKKEELTQMERSEVNTALRELGMYEKQSSLLFACRNNASVLSNVGCTYIDDDRNKTAAAYYEYVKYASL